MRKIYDCFPFFNELDLLELRLEEAYNHVDHFVITESHKSFQNRDKPFILEANWDRFKKYHDKMIYVKVEDMPDGDGNANHWKRENFQPEVLSRGLTSASDDDIIVISDCDEMLRGSTYDFMRNDIGRKTWICRQPIFWARLNYWQAEPRGYNISSMASVKKYMGSPQHMRNLRDWAYTLPENYDALEVKVIHHAGWHFTYLGDDETAKVKLVNFAHDEASHLAANVQIESAIARNVNPIDAKGAGRYERVFLDEYFPQTILNNLDKWKHLLVSNPDTNIRSFLPPYEK